MTLSIDATYSAEDNKLRLYACSRLDDELYARVKNAGFRWAPRQELFVAPGWTPAREDLCLELAGEITAEQTTMVERAEQKAERLDELSAKRSRESSSYHDAADRISQRFANGQPILIGHHSEKKARRDQEKMHANMDKAVKAASAVDYWKYRATGVERHANRQSVPAVRARRIKTLLKSLRDKQRDLNHAYICVDLWTKVSKITDVEKFKKAAEHWAGARLNTGSTARYGAWSDLTDGKLDHREFVTDVLAAWERSTQSANTFRWISHILNRLGYERFELGGVPRYSGDISATVLQAFAREHGAHKPKAKNEAGDVWVLNSSVPLPPHIADGCTIEASEDEWRDLMQSCGYCVPKKKERRKTTSVQVPLINLSLEEGKRLQEKWNEQARVKNESRVHGDMKHSNVFETTQRVFSANSKGSYSSLKTIELDKHGLKIWSNYKGKSGEPVCRIRTTSNGTAIYSADSVIVITDKPSKPLPIDGIPFQQKRVRPNGQALIHQTQ